MSQNTREQGDWSVKCYRKAKWSESWKWPLGFFSFLRKKLFFCFYYIYMSVLSFMPLSYFYFELHPPLLSAPGEVKSSSVSWWGGTWEFDLTPARTWGLIGSVIQRDPPWLLSCVLWAAVQGWGDGALRQHFCRFPVVWLWGNSSASIEFQPLDLDIEDVDLGLGRVVWECADWDASSVPLEWCLRVMSVFRLLIKMESHADAERLRGCFCLAFWSQQLQVVVGRIMLLLVVCRKVHFPSESHY